MIAPECLIPDAIFADNCGHTFRLVTFWLCSSRDKHGKRRVCRGHSYRSSGEGSD